MSTATAASSGTNSASDRMCRICFDSASEPSGPERLIRPCRCAGSSQHVHLGCLNEWRIHSSNKKSYFQCEVCGYKYQFRRTAMAAVLANAGILRAHACLCNDLTQLPPVFLHATTTVTFLLLYVVITYAVLVTDKVVNFTSSPPSDITFFWPSLEYWVLSAVVLAIAGYAVSLFMLWEDEWRQLPRLLRAVRIDDLIDNRRDAVYAACAIFVVCGLLLCVYGIYRSLRKATRSYLSKASDAILEVTEETNGKES